MEIEVPEELNRILEKICQTTKQQPEHVIIEASSQYFGKKKQRKERFHNERKFGIPKNCFVLFALPQHEWEKVSEWTMKKQRVSIVPGSNGEIWLVNEDNLEKHHSRRHKRAQKAK